MILTELTLTTGETLALRAILEDLASMEPAGLPRDASLATAAGPLRVRTINRAKWLHQRTHERLSP